MLDIVCEEINSSKDQTWASVESKIERQCTKKLENSTLKKMLESFREAAKIIESAAKERSNLEHVSKKLES